MTQLQEIGAAELAGVDGGVLPVFAAGILVGLAVGIGIGALVVVLASE